MSTTVWKFELEPRFGFQMLLMPEGARFASLASQPTERYGPVLATWWLIPDPNLRYHSKELFLLGTGHQLPDRESEGWSYRATTLQPESGLVFHLFEKQPQAEHGVLHSTTVGNTTSTINQFVPKVDEAVDERPLAWYR